MINSLVIVNTLSLNHLSRGFLKLLLVAPVVSSGSVTDDLFPSEWLLDTKLDYSKRILNQQEIIGNKSQYILESYRDGLLETGKLYLSGHAVYSHYQERTDTAGKFPILGRFPSQHDSGRSGKEDILDVATLGLTYAPTDSARIFVRGIYTDLQFPRQENAQIREAFVTFGDLSQNPWYLSVGKMSVNFGHNGAYNPITHSVNNHFYQTDTQDVAAELGYVASNWKVAFTALNGGRQLRVADTPDQSFLSNFALSGQYDTNVGKWDVSVGGGYLYSSIYDTDNANHPGVDSNPQTTRERNGVVNAWTEWQNGPVSVMAEVSLNERDWPASGASVQAVTLGAAYDTELLDKPTRFALVYGRGELGNEGDEWESLQQLAASVETFVTPNFALSMEYVYNRSFIPLIKLDRTAIGDVDTNTLIFSGRYFF